MQVATRANPTVLRRQLGAELRRMREQAKRTVAWTAGQLGWSESKVSRVETANIGIRRPDLERLLELYGAPAVERDRFDRPGRPGPPAHVAGGLRREPAGCLRDV